MIGDRGNADYKATDESVPVTAKKEIKLLRLPRILVLHMCRFTYDAQGLTKLHKQMQCSVRLRFATLAVCLFCSCRLFSLICIHRPWDPTGGQTGND